MSVAAVAVAVLIGASLQSATGFGFALITAPAVFAVFEPGEALTTLVVMSAVLSTLVLFGERRDISVRGADVARLGAWGVPGLAAGAVVLGAVGKPALQVGVGVAVVTAALVEARTPTGQLAARRPWPAAPIGAAAGFLTTTTGVNGPVFVMYFLRSGADQHVIRDSLAATFLVFTPLAVVALAAAGMLGFEDMGALELILLLALVAVGRPVGRALFLRLSAERFRALGLALALVAGAVSVAAGLAG
jgi:uncharacterized membrane protein YfcA